MPDKPNRGRPIKASKTKQMNVRVEIAKLESDKMKERTKYMSFSQYVNSLIDKDFEG
ncbi:MAG: hypothetical protein K0S09_43 [Sphingobacteriaceae bacterium]|jgi:hypothetical protein|nr:hypothetical protein [Sphingobacteriaceae bacterium]